MDPSSAAASTAAAAAAAAGDDDAPHVVFFPLMNPGNTIPMVDVARCLARRGVRCTVASTPADTASIRRTVEASAALGHLIRLRTVPFLPPSATGLPAAIDDLAQVPLAQFFGVITSLDHLSPDLSFLLAELRPDALVSPGLLPWTADVAAEVGIPRILFDAAGAFPYFVFFSLPTRPASTARPYLPLPPAHWHRRSKIPRRGDQHVPQDGARVRGPPQGPRPRLVPARAVAHPRPRRARAPRWSRRWRDLCLERN